MNILTPKIKLVISAVVGLLLLSVIVVYFTTNPSNDRIWADDQGVLPYAVFDEDSVEVFNIRNFTYTSVETYTPDYYNKIFKLDEIASIDYIVEPFGSIGAAHTFVSFGFENGDYVALSVEIRKEIGETFSPTKGLLRNYELMYVIADEKDVVKLRANYRKNDVYLYPVKTSSENMKKMFIDMLTRANKLKEEPEFYNTLTNTCTTNIASHINNISPSRIPWDVRLLLPENSDELAYELGLVSNDVPLTELRKKNKINALAEIHASNPDFSHLIRQTQ
jgi:hypothetical protein